MIESYRYDAFGAPTIRNAANSQIPSSNYKNRFLFTGREYAQKFGVYEWSEWGHRDMDGQAHEGSGRVERERTSQYRNRAYHPGLGRFTSEDPLGFAAGDINLFRYCGNDPVDHTDPNGTITLWAMAMLWQGGGSGAVSEQVARLEAARMANINGGGEGEPAGNSGSNSMARKDEGAKQNEQKSVSGAGVPAAVTRSAGSSFTRTGTNGKEIAVIRWVYTIKDASGKSVGRGIPVGEKVTFSEGVDAPPPGANKSWTTNSYGQVRDTYSIPFDSPRGRVNITQSLLVGAGTSTLTGRWETVVRANGSFNMIGETPSGDTMNLH